MNEKNHRQNLQALLRKIRKDAGMSQEDLAEALGKPQSFISKYESGERKLDILEVREICQHLGINLILFVSLLEEELANYNASKSEV